MSDSGRFRKTLVKNSDCNFYEKCTQFNDSNQLRTGFLIIFDPFRNFMILCNITFNMKKRKYLHIVYIICCSSLFACNNSKTYPLSCLQVENNYYSYLEKAKDTAYKIGLLQSLRDISIDNPACEQIYILSFDIHLLIKDYEEAKKSLFKAISINSLNVYTLFNLGKLYSLEKNYDSAIHFFRVAGKLKSQNGVIVEKTNELYEISDQPNFNIEYTEILFNNALASYYANYLLDANNEFEYCIRNKKKLKEAYFYLGLIYLEIQRYEKVCSNMQLAKENGNPDAEMYISKYCKSDEKYNTSPILKSN